MPRTPPLLVLVTVLLFLAPWSAANQCGDIDGDGSVSKKDAKAIARAAAGTMALTPVQAEAADVDGDGRVTVLDVILVGRFLAGQTVTLVCPCNAPTSLPLRGNAYTALQLQFMADLALMSSNCIDQPDSPLYAVFHGCYDWHSAVHMHWMLIRYSRVTGDTTYDAQVQSSLLVPGGLAAEAAYLVANPVFEMPYGRAWFLRLAIEYERHFGNTSLRALADSVLNSIVTYYASGQPSPLAFEYSNASWAVAQAIDYARHTGDAGTEAILLGAAATHFSPLSVANIGFDGDFPGLFFSRFGNWCHLIATADCATALDDAMIARADPRPDFLPVNVTPSSPAHTYGMNPSRGWAMASLYRRTRNPLYLAAWQLHVDSFIQDHYAYSGSYLNYDHWVPSFCMYAITEPLGF